MNYYLKTTDEAELWSALESAGLAIKQFELTDPLNQRPEDTSPESDWQPSGEYTWKFTGIALDIIGTLYVKGDVTTNEEGREQSEMIALDGFHANVKATAGIQGLPTIDTPKTPLRTWAGE